MNVRALMPAVATRPGITTYDTRALDAYRRTTTFWCWWCGAWIRGRR